MYYSTIQITHAARINRGDRPAIIDTLFETLIEWGPLTHYSFLTLTEQAIIHCYVPFNSQCDRGLRNSISR